MSTPKRHHEIPQVILRNFVDADGMLHCYRKEADRTFASTPENVFVRRGLYSKKGVDGGEDPSKEQELAVRIEGAASCVVDKIVSCARAGQLPGLSRAEKLAWDLFFCVQCRRTAAARGDLEGSDLVAWAIDAVERMVGPLLAEERAEIDGSPERRRAAVGEAWLETLTLPKGDLFETLRRKGLLVLVLEDADEAFVIGDVPIMPMVPPGATLDAEDAADLFPVARDVAVACSGDWWHEELRLVPKSGDGTQLLRAINLAILEQSSMVATPSRRLVESLGRAGGERR